MMDLIAPHRRSLAAALSTLTADQWRGPTLCAGWTPAHVLAHLTMPFRISEPDFMAGLQRCGGDFTRFSDEIAARDSMIAPADLVDVLLQNADNPWAPPGGGLTAALSHDVIHGLDITWPLSLPEEIPADAMRLVLDSITSPLPRGAEDLSAAEITNAETGNAGTGSAGTGAEITDAQGEAVRSTLFGFPLSGIRVRATDLDWSAGDGEELAGQSRDLLPLLAGRLVTRELFAGPGVARAWSLADR
jgi:uncharacterized protein (TIGR03083 family)